MGTTNFRTFIVDGQNGIINIIRRIRNNLKLQVFKKLFLRAIAISSPSIVLAILLLELAIRLFLKPSDAPDIYFDKTLGSIFVPNQSGVYVKGANNEIQARFRINNYGWNSPVDYKKEKSLDINRIAVIGDSYVEALQVDYDKSYPYLLSETTGAQVYTFGHSGANLVHYLHLVRYAAENFKPDIVVVNIVENDFKESIYGNNRKDNWSLSLQDSVIEEKPPKEISNLSIKRLLRKSALARYLTINLDLVNTSQIINKLFFAETKEFTPSNSNWDINYLNKLTDYTVEKLEKLSQENNFQLVLVLDVNRKSIYGHTSLAETNHYKLNEGLKRSAEKFEIELIDLSDTFQANWKSNQKRFDWEFDEHWNEYGHKLISETLTKLTPFKNFVNQTQTF